MRKIFLLSTIAATLFSGCNDDSFYELEQAPNPLIIDVADMERATAGAYYALTGNEGNQSNFDALAVAAAAISDESRFISQAGGNGDVESFYLRNSSTDVGISNSAFIASYKAIGQCNQWLPILENGDLEGLDGASQLPRMQGELYFLRAYSYLNLAKFFGNPYTAGTSSRYFPLRLSPVTSLEEANAPAAPIGDVYDAIVQDLVRAVELLPKNAEGQAASYQHGRANKFAAAALLARVYVQMGRLADALPLCNLVIDQNEGAYSLNEQPIEAWNKPWSGGSKEVLWYYSMGDTPNNPNGLGGTTSGWKLPRRYSFFNYATSSTVDQMPGNSQNSINASARTLAISDALLTKAGWITAERTPTQAALNDLRFTQLVHYNAGNDPTFPSVPQGQYWVNKYWRGPLSSRRVGALPLIRLSEVYLTRALIHFENGALQEVANDLNAVRRRAWDEAAAGQPYTELTADQITADLIHTERMIELMFEGDRPYYLQGLKLAIPNGDRDDGQISFDAPSLFFQIPVAERELNPGLGG